MFIIFSSGTTEILTAELIRTSGQRNTRCGLRRSLSISFFGSLIADNL